jgi:hypothetical protein
MTELEQVEYKLNYLLSKYDERYNEPTYRLQIQLLNSLRRKLINSNADRTPAED